MSHQSRSVRLEGRDSQQLPLTLTVVRSSLRNLALEIIERTSVLPRLQLIVPGRLDEMDSAESFEDLYVGVL